MSSRSRRQRQQRRRQHAEAQHRSALPTPPGGFPRVKQAHIVPKAFQRAFAVDGKVALHVDNADQCVLVSVGDSATRGPYYRRTRPDGSVTDDVEASLAHAESKAAPALRDTVAERRLTLERKGALSQLFGLQLLRGPDFFRYRGELLDELLSGPPETLFKRRALQRAGGDGELLRSQLLAAMTDPTYAYVGMLQRAVTMASILGHMSWHLVTFDEPLLLFADHPIVIWPLDQEIARPADRPRHGPINALEARVPLAPDLALVLNWDPAGSRPDPIRAGRRLAAELNSFGRAQAERQWMHRPGIEPPFAPGPCRPVSRRLNPQYDRQAAERSPARARAERTTKALAGSRTPATIEVVCDLP